LLAESWLSKGGLSAEVMTVSFVPLRLAPVVCSLGFDPRLDSKSPQPGNVLIIRRKPMQDWAKIFGMVTPLNFEHKFTLMNMKGVCQWK
jgi:hypothetical protein